MGKLHLNYDVTKLRGADYNPRKISDLDIKVLAESIQRLGLVKPLIVRGNLLVAGHQRTKALRSLGITTAPVYLLSQDTTTYDEVRFNQLHNGTDLDAGDENCLIDGELVQGYQVVSPERISGNFRGRLAVVRGEIARLITLYGAWGGVVATTEGKVIHAAQYALAAKLTNTPLTVYAIAPESEAEYRKYLSREYGQFSYEHLEKITYNQNWAQMWRLRGGKTDNRSTLYRTMVIPFLEQNPQARGVDFGSGQGDYAKMLRGQGYDLIDVELFRRKGKVGIDVGAVNQMIDVLLHSLRSHGQFDYVVCDSVLNSTDCLAAEDAVMRMLNLLCRKQGLVFFSGRSREAGVDKCLETSIHTAKKEQRRVQFLDEHGYSALYRHGAWFYQKFHTKSQAAALAQKFGLTILKQKHSSSNQSWQITAKKETTVSLDEAIAACEYEFNLPISKTRRLNRHQDVIAVVEQIYAS